MESYFLSVIRDRLETVSFPGAIWRDITLFGYLRLCDSVLL